jgi:hypothetical protein
MVDRDGEVTVAFELANELGGLVRPNLPRATARLAQQMAVLPGGMDVELLATVSPVAMVEVPELLEDIERSIDG